MKFRFPIVIIDEDFRSENTSGLGIRVLDDGGYGDARLPTICSHGWRLSRRPRPQASKSVGGAPRVWRCVHAESPGEQALNAAEQTV